MLYTSCISPIHQPINKKLNQQKNCNHHNSTDCFHQFSFLWNNEFVEEIFREACEPFANDFYNQLDYLFENYKAKKYVP